MGLAKHPCTYIHTEGEGDGGRGAGRERRARQTLHLIYLSRTIVLTSYGEASRSKKKEKSRHNTGMVRTQNIPALSTQCLEVKWADTSTEMEGSAVTKGN